MYYVSEGRDCLFSLLTEAFIQMSNNVLCQQVDNRKVKHLTKWQLHFAGYPLPVFSLQHISTSSAMYL
jgi:hypothetical protein